MDLEAQSTVKVDPNNGKRYCQRMQQVDRDSERTSNYGREA